MAPESDPVGGHWNPFYTTQPLSLGLSSFYLQPSSGIFSFVFSALKSPHLEMESAASDPTGQSLFEEKHVDKVCVCSQAECPMWMLTTPYLYDS